MHRVISSFTVVIMLSALYLSLISINVFLAIIIIGLFISNIFVEGLTLFILIFVFFPVNLGLTASIWYLLTSKEKLGIFDLYFGLIISILTIVCSLFLLDYFLIYRLNPYVVGNWSPMYRLITSPTSSLNLSILIFFIILANFLFFIKFKNFKKKQIGK